MPITPLLAHRSHSRNACHPRHRRLTTWLLATVLLCQSLVPTMAAVHRYLEDAMIGHDLASEPQFERAHQISYQYRPLRYLSTADAAGYASIQDFHQRLKREHPRTLGRPTYVPLSLEEDMPIRLRVYPLAKRIGTPFVQARYVRQQINRLLRRTLIDSDRVGFGSEQTQLQSLYDNARAFAAAHAHASYARWGARLPFARNDAPMDMVWPELRTVNGQALLVPVVYLTAATFAARRVEVPTNTFIGEARLGSLTLEGATLTTGRSTYIKTLNDITNNGGKILAAGDLGLVAGGQFTNLSGDVMAREDLTIVAQRIVNRTLVHRYELGGQSEQRFGEIARLSAEGDVLFRSYSDIVVAGAEVHAGKDVRFAADGNIYVGPVALERRAVGGDHGWHESSHSSVSYLRSRLTAEQSLSLVANGTIKIEASDMVADRGHIEMLAGLGITVQDALASRQFAQKGRFGKTSVETSAYKTVAIRSLLDAGKGITLHTALGDITLKSAQITSGDGTRVTAENGKVNLLVTRETDHYQYSSVKEGLFTKTTLDRGHAIDTVAQNTIVGGFKAEALYGLNVEYPGDPTLGLDEQVATLSQLPGLDWMARVRQDFPDARWTAIETQYREWNEKNTSLSPAFGAVIAIAVAIASQGAAANFASYLLGGVSEGALHAALMAGTASVLSQSALAVANGTVNGDVAGAMEQLASSDTLKNVVVAMVTAGAIESIDADLFKVAKDADGAATLFKEALAGQSLTLEAQMYQALTQSVVKAGISTVVYGHDFDRLFEQMGYNLLGTALDRLGQHMTATINSAFTGDGGLDTALRYITHAGVGCILGTVNSYSSKDARSHSACGAGAAGQVAGELIVSGLRSDEDITEAHEALKAFAKENADLVRYLREEEGYSDADIVEALGERSNLSAITDRLSTLRRQGVDLARLGAAISAFALGASAAGVDIAADLGQTAAENNALFLLATHANVLEAVDRVLATEQRLVDALYTDPDFVRYEEGLQARLESMAMHFVLPGAEALALVKALAQDAMDPGSPAERRQLIRQVMQAQGASEAQIDQVFDDIAIDAITGGVDQAFRHYRDAFGTFVQTGSHSYLKRLASQGQVDSAIVDGSIRQRVLDGQLPTDDMLAMGPFIGELAEASAPVLLPVEAGVSDLLDHLDSPLIQLAWTAIQVASGPVAFVMQQAFAASPLGQRAQEEAVHFHDTATAYVEANSRLTQEEAAAGMAGASYLMAGAVGVPTLKQAGTAIRDNLDAMRDGRKERVQPLGFATTNEAMRQRIRGKPYRDPYTNEWRDPEPGVKMQADHVYPAAEIQKLDGFSALTVQQKKQIIYDTDGIVGNVQPLPDRLNGSKGKKLADDWTVGPRDKLFGARKPIHPDYIEWLRERQEEAKDRIVKQINKFNAQNAGEA